jgi:hypothetical protein
MMYVVLVEHKSKEAMADLMAAIIVQFPLEKFSIVGSEEKGYQFHINGVGDERVPRIYASKFLKTWKPKPKEDEIKVIHQTDFKKVAVAPIKLTGTSKFDDILKSILPK